MGRLVVFFINYCFKIQEYQLNTRVCILLVVGCSMTKLYWTPWPKVWRHEGSEYLFALPFLAFLSSFCSYFRSIFSSLS